MQCSKPSLSVDCTSRSGTYVGQLDYLVGAKPFPAIMGDERIRTLDDAWRHAIRQCDRGAGVLPDGLTLSSIAVGIALSIRLEGRRNGLSPPRCCLCRSVGAANPVRS
jgi:hypothetical protein